ncbi:MAG: hypothetical protein ACXVGB_13445, partial [Mycobacteriaceae bacterium]
HPRSDLSALEAGAEPQLSASRRTLTRSLYSPPGCFPRRSSYDGRSQQVLSEAPVCDPDKRLLKRGARRALIEAVVGGAGTALLLPPEAVAQRGSVRAV